MKRSKIKRNMITSYRMELGQDIRSFSRGCGVSENLMGKYEKGYCAPSLQNFCKIVKYLRNNEVEVAIFEFILNILEINNKK